MEDRFSKMAPEHNPVVELIARRARSGSTPGNRDDGCRLALLVEGGGMRAILSAGMLLAFRNLGLTRCFDAVYGTSAGAVNAAFFIADQMEECCRSYLEEVNAPNFMAPIPLAFFYVFFEKPIMKITYMINRLKSKGHWPDVNRVNASDVELNLVAASVTRERLAAFNEFENQEDLDGAMWAASAMPLVTGPPYEYRNERYWDGGILQAVPIKRAREDGCTHVFCLLTKKHGAVRDKPVFLERFMYAPLMARRSKKLARQWLENFKYYSNVVHGAIDASRRCEPLMGVDVAAVHLPPGMPAPGRITKDVTVLEQARDNGYSLVNSVFEGIDLRRTLRPFDEMPAAAIA